MSTVCISARRTTTDGTALISIGRARRNAANNRRQRRVSGNRRAGCNSTTVGSGVLRCERMGDEPLPLPDGRIKEWLCVVSSQEDQLLGVGVVEGGSTTTHVSKRYNHQHHIRLRALTTQTRGCLPAAAISRKHPWSSYCVLESKHVSCA